MQLFHQRRAGFTRFREGVGREEDPGSTVTQHEIGVRLLTRQFWQRNRIFLRRRDFTVTQNLTGVLTFVVGARHVFPETPHFQVHFRATLLALNDRAVIAFDAELTLFDLITITRWVIPADVQFTFRID